MNYKQILSDFEDEIKNSRLAVRQLHMSRFLSVIPVDEAIRIIRQIAGPPSEEEVSLSDSQGRVLAHDISSDIDIPGFDRSTVDGYAVFSSDTTGAGESIPSMLLLTGRIAMGDIPNEPLTPGTCRYIPTGGIPATWRRCCRDDRVL